MGYNGHATGCGCEPCRLTRLAKNLADRRRRAAITAGTWRPTVDVRPVAEHLEHLLAAGCAAKQISELTGLSEVALRDIRYGRVAYVYASTAEAVTSVTVGRVYRHVLDAGRGFVDATGTRRRLQALAVMGHPPRVVAERAGVSQRVRDAMRGDVPKVSARVAAAVARVYDELWRTHGDSVRTCKYAERRGWVSPLGWDDDLIDDPAAAPLVGEKDPSRLVTIAEDADELERAGEGWGAIEAKLGVTWDRIHASRRARRESETAA